MNNFREAAEQLKKSDKADRRERVIIISSRSRSGTAFNSGGDSVNDITEMKLCPYRKYSERFNGGYIEHFCQCVGSDCTAWSETDKICSLCSDKRIFKVEARVDTRYNL